MANRMMLVRLVMLSAAISPLYLSGEELKHTKGVLLLACIMNATRSGAMHGRRTAFLGGSTLRRKHGRIFAENQQNGGQRR